MSAGVDDGERAKKGGARLCAQEVKVNLTRWSLLRTQRDRLDVVRQKRTNNEDTVKGFLTCACFLYIFVPLL